MVLTRPARVSLSDRLRLRRCPSGWQVQADAGPLARASWCAPGSEGVPRSGGAENRCHKRRFKWDPQRQVSVLKDPPAIGSHHHPTKTGGPAGQGVMHPRIHCSANEPGERGGHRMVDWARSPGPARSHGGLQHRRIGLGAIKLSQCSLVASKGLSRSIGATAGSGSCSATDPVARDARHLPPYGRISADKSGADRFPEPLAP